MSSSRIVTDMSDYTFRTRQYEVQYTRTNFLSFALLMRLPIKMEDWPICAAVSVGNKKTRQQLIRELIVDGTEKIVTEKLCSMARASL